MKKVKDSKGQVRQAKRSASAESSSYASWIAVPWGHHRTLIDKCKGDRDKALFYVRRTIQNGWSRNSLLNWLSTDLYEREGKTRMNFARCVCIKSFANNSQWSANNEKSQR